MARLILLFFGIIVLLKLCITHTTNCSSRSNSSRITATVSYITDAVAVKVVVFVGLGFVRAIAELDDVADVQNTEHGHDLMHKNVNAEDQSTKLELENVEFDIPFRTNQLGIQNRLSIDRETFFSLHPH